MGVPKSDSVGQNMTAGLDSKSELPVMLFKVQDRDIQRDSKFFDNSNSHGQRKSGGGDGGVGGEDENQSLSGCDSESAGNIRESVSGSVSGSGSGSGNGSGTRSGRSSRGRLTIGSLSEAGNSSRSSGSSIKQIISRHFRSIGESLNTDEKQPQPESNSQEPSQQQPLRKSQQEPTKQTIDYPWINWSLLMLLGLIVPPLYFVIPIGLMDRDYLGLRYANKPSKKFTTTQKIISLILGILWLLIVLAMIGVGIGLGVTRES
ncbi:putative integral membrane protein [Candida albicans]|uniref:Putative integral membrane protein n=1 Tax=Candida albicans TaxID=5476 RepID=A0A8H6F1A5_CANAX|nr:putative integral membrane protein [Candida albicans]